MDDVGLRRRVREAIRAGELPGRFPDELLGGPSSGADCCVCGQSTEGGMELELVFRNGAGRAQSHCAHPHCLPAFQREVQALAGSGPSNGDSSRGLPDAVPARDGRADGDAAAWHLA
jgi:hypothetical protein